MSSKIEGGFSPRISRIRSALGVQEHGGLMTQPDVPTFPRPDSKSQLPPMFGHSRDIDPMAIPQEPSSVTLFDAVSTQMSPDRRRRANKGYARRFVLASRHTDDNGSESLTQTGITEAQRMAGMAAAMITKVSRDGTAFESNWEPTHELSRQADAAHAVVEAHDRPRRLLSQLRLLSREERALADGIAAALDARTLLDPNEAERIVKEKRVFDALRTAAVVEVKESHPDIRRKDRIAREGAIAERTSALWGAYQAAEFSDSGQLLIPQDDPTGVYARLAELLPQIEARKAGVKNAAKEWDAKARDRELRRVRVYMNRVTPLEQQILKEETGLQPETKEERLGRYGMTVLLNAGVQGVKDAASWAGGIAASAADVLGLMHHFDSPRDVLIAVGGSYVLWGLGLAKSLKENWDRLEDKGNSVSALSLAAYEKAKVLFPDNKFKQWARTSLGYIATDLAQEVAYYIAAGLAFAAANGASAGEVLIGGNTVAFLTEIGQAIISKRMRTPSQLEETLSASPDAVTESVSDVNQESFVDSA